MAVLMNGLYPQDERSGEERHDSREMTMREFRGYGEWNKSS